MSAGSPSTTDVAWVPEGPKEEEMVTPEPGLGLGEGGGQGAVGGLGRRVGHQVGGAARGGAGREGGEGQAAEGQGGDAALRASR